MIARSARLSAKGTDNFTIVGTSLKCYAPSAAGCFAIVESIGLTSVLYHPSVCTRIESMGSRNFIEVMCALRRTPFRNRVCPLKKAESQWRRAYSPVSKAGTARPSAISGR
jgi:hypothetical protein